ncbi:MAG TPA: hypothetical protein PLD84_00915 [Chitinophagales bacterium]|nr:hypothetical protein [Chitinophagales bacterium]
MKATFCYSATLLLLLFGSCSYFGSSDKEEIPVARVYDKYLYQTELEGIGRGAARPEDSIQVVKNYVDSWIRHNLMLRYAQDNLPEEEKVLNEQLRDYRESLLIYLYEKELLNDKLDTVVQEQDIVQYYSDHKETFELKQSIAQVKYIMLRMDARVKLDSVRIWMRKTTPDNYPKLRGFCNEYAVRYSITDSVWYNKDELAAFLPVGKFNADNAQLNRSYLEIPDSGYAYLMKFEDFRIKGSDAPINFVREEITSIILNKRKLSFISTIHKSIYDEALKKNNFETFLDSAANAKR